MLQPYYILLSYREDPTIAACMSFPSHKMRFFSSDLTCVDINAQAVSRSLGQQEVYGQNDCLPHVQPSHMMRLY